MEDTRASGSGGRAGADILSGEGLRRFAAVLVSLGEFVDGYDFLVMGAALLFLTPQFHLGPSIIGVVGAASYLGSVVGLIVFGNLADKFGRRVIFMFNLLFFVVFSVLSALVNSAGLLIVLRFLVGLGIGMDIPTSSAYLAEIAPHEHRGRFAGTLPNVTWLSGAVVSVLLALALENAVGLATWRWLFGLGAVPALLVLAGRQLLPESPRWLRMQGRDVEAQRAFQRLGLVPPENPVVRSPARFKDLLAPAYRTRTTAMFGVFALNCFAGATATLAGPYVLRSTGLTIGHSLVFSLVGYVLDLVGVGIGFLLIDTMSRRTLGIITSAGACAAGLLMAWLGPINSAIMVIFYLLFSVIVWTGPAVLVWVWASELFPTEIRGSGQGVTQSGCRLAIALNIIVVPLGLAAFGLHAITIFALAYGVVALLLYRFAFFDTTGKVLEETSAPVA